MHSRLTWRVYLVRFSLRSVFIVTTVLCIGVAFWSCTLLPFLESENQQRARVATLDKLGVLYHYDGFEEWGWARFQSTRYIAEAVEHLRNSRDPVNAVYIDGQRVSDDMLMQLSVLSSVDELSIRCGIIDGCKLCLPQIKRLSVVGTQWDWAAHAGFPNLEILVVDAKQVTEDLVARLNELPRLRQLTVESVDSIDRIRSQLLALHGIRSNLLMGAKLRPNDGALTELRARFRVGINGHWYRHPMPSTLSPRPAR